MKKKETSSKKIHHWRFCPGGEHWVTTHPLHVPPSKKNPGGTITTRHSHCAKNPSGKDQLYPDEMREISRRHFSDLKDLPCSLSLGYADGASYDDLIAGWVQCWNEVLKPSEPLDSNLVKALIATESRFVPDLLASRKNQNSARGLMQILNDTRKILGDEKGEIKDHFITVTRSDLNDPSIYICAGVRWLFHKRDLISKKLKRQVNWVETVGKYKGTSKVSKSRAKELMDRFEKRHKELEQCAKE